MLTECITFLFLIYKWLFLVVLLYKNKVAECHCFHSVDAELSKVPIQNLHLHHYQVKYKCIKTAGIVLTELDRNTKFIYYLENQSLQASLVKHLKLRCIIYM